MKLHYALFGVVATAALLAACGGGGGVPSLSSTASPIGGPGNPAATSSSRPASVGDTFAFAGASLESDVYTYPVASPFPNTTAAAQITENVVVTASANPLGSGGTDFHAVTTTAAAQVTHTATSDAYYSTVAAGSGTNFVLNAQQSVDDSNNKFVWNYTTPQILDEIPETSGATWTNSPAGTYAETDADGATVARTIAASGTYSETDTFPGTALPVQIAVNADGSGTLSENYFNFLPIDFAYSAPTAGAISISYLIPTPAPAPGATGTPAPNPPTVIATPAAWFSPSPTLYSESDTVATGVTYPVACAVPKSFGLGGNSVTQVIRHLDPVLGYSETTTTTAYTQVGFGPVCVSMSDVQTYYYDYLNDSLTTFSGFPNFVGTPQLTKTYTQTLTLQSAGTSISSTSRSAQSATATPISPVLFAADRTRFIAHLQQERMTAVKAFTAALLRLAPTLSHGGSHS